MPITSATHEAIIEAREKLREAQGLLQASTIDTVFRGVHLADASALLAEAKALIDAIDLDVP